MAIPLLFEHVRPHWPNPDEFAGPVELYSLFGHDRLPTSTDRYIGAASLIRTWLKATIPQ